MMRAALIKNKKGAALIYSIMILLLLVTVIVSVTALASSSYNDALLTVADDQSYYYAKSVGLSVKEQFKDGYNIAKIITQLDTLEEQYDKDEISDPVIKGTFNIADGEGEFVSGTVQIRYARNEDDSRNPYVIEVKTSCVVNNSLAIVTSVYSCEEDSENEQEHIESAMSDYDVILTKNNPSDELNFNFAQAGESGTSNLRVYVYCGEDDSVTNTPFKLYMNMAASLTTTGKSTIESVDAYGNPRYGAITGKLVSYGDITLINTMVLASAGNVQNDIHADGSVTLSGQSLVAGNIYARGGVSIVSLPDYLHDIAIVASAPYYRGSNWYQSATNIYAQGDVYMGPKAYISGSILTHGNVRLTGERNTTILCGDTCVQGDIYADGDVVIENGAIVLGSVYAKGNVTVRQGSFVRGIVQSINGNIEVLGAGVGGWVNCPNGNLTLGSKGYELGTDYLARGAILDPAGIEYYSNLITFGGIGFFYQGTHTCKTLTTHDSNQFSKVQYGNLYVSSHPYASMYTDIYSIWVIDSLFLNDSVARFGGAYRGLNEYGNPYTHLGALVQKLDLYNTKASPWVDLAGARIGNLILGENNGAMFDGYITNGWITGSVYAHSILICDMKFEANAYIYAQQYAHFYGSGNSANGNYVEGVTKIPSGANVVVEAKDASYEGEFMSDTRYGLTFGINTEADPNSIFYVGSTLANAGYAYVIIGDEVVGHIGTTKFYGTMHAYVSAFKITENARLSISKSTATSSRARIYCEIVDGGGNPNYENEAVRPNDAANSFYVAPSGDDGGKHRYSSLVEVKGSVYLAGCLYNFKHFNNDTNTASFTNTSTAKINGTLITDAQTVRLTGKTCFTKVEAINPDCTVTLNSEMQFSAFRVNGTLNLNNKVLTVNGDMYVDTMSSHNMYNTTVKGNLTIMRIATNSPLTASKKLSVTKDLCLNAGDISFTSANHTVGGTLQTKNGSVTLSGGASVKNVVTYANLTVNANGKVTGAFDVGGTFHLAGGEVISTSDQDCRTKVYKHTAGTIKYKHVTVTSTGTAIDISGTGVGTTVGDTVFLYAPNGSASVTGGAAVDYNDGNLIVKDTSKVEGGFRCGISVSNGYLTVGNPSHAADSYEIGCSIAANSINDTSSDGYCVIYAKKDITWYNSAKSSATGFPMYSFAPRVSAGEKVTMGSAGNYVMGLFDMIAGKTLDIYVEKVDSLYATTTSKINIKAGGYLGSSARPDGTRTGAHITGGNLEVSGQNNTAKLGGNNVIENGNMIIKNAISADARIKCKQIEGLQYIKEETSFADASRKGIFLSLYIAAPSGGNYELTRSLLKDKDGYTGALTVMGNLSYPKSVCVEGELHVEGILTYGGDQVNLQSLGGLYCLNPKVNLSSLDGSVKDQNIQLPNVTEVTLNADIGGLNAANITKFTMNYNVEGSLSLPKCEELTIGSGKGIGETLIISTTGKVTNNGTIGKDVQCGSYTGTGTVGGKVVLQQEGVTSEIKGSVSGSIWTKGSLNITTTATIGSKNSYIYAQGDIIMDGVTFANQMDYILTTNGHIEMTNCMNIPKVWNMKGHILFKNNSSHKATIASVLSYGTYIEFGTSGSTMYQTVTGNVEWSGNAKSDKTSSGYGVEFWGKGTKIEGDLLLLGEGNVHLANGYFNVVKAKHKGTLVTSEYNTGTVAKMYVNSDGDIKVTSVEVKFNVTEELQIYGTSGSSGTPITLDKGTFAAVNIKGGKSLTLSGGTYSGDIWMNNVTTVNVNTDVNSSKFTVYTGDYFKLKEDKKIAGDLRMYNVKDIYVYGNVGGKFYHTAPKPNSASDFNVIRLGQQSKQITIGGSISARGKVIDNAKITKANSKRAIQGAYYVDINMSQANCPMLAFQTECGGDATVIGAIDGVWNITETEFNINGRLVVRSFYDEASKSYYHINFSKPVRANALVVNAALTSGNMSSSLNSTNVLIYAASGGSNSDLGQDKRAYMYNLEKAPVGGDIYRVSRKTDCAESDVVYFKANVYLTKGNGFNGTCHAANTKFGGQLYTDGQVALRYCLLYSAGFSSDTNHCSYTSNGDGINVSGDGAFLHADSGTGGENYFKHVQTYSNVSVYYGVTHILSSSVFKGTVYSGSDGETNYKGHRATKLFYFGDSLRLSGQSAITSAQQSTVKVAAARTIVWVNKGALVLEDGSYIGQRVKKQSNYETKDYSQHPGVFVSDTGSGTVSVNGTSYNRGSVNVKGKSADVPSTITLDICAYREINIKDYGVIVAKYGSKDWENYSGIYVTKGAITESGSGWICVLHNRGDRYGSRHYWASNSSDGISDSSAYVPDGSKYVTCFNTKWETYKKYPWGSHYDTSTKTYSQTKAQLTQCYTPASTVPSGVTTAKALKSLYNATSGYSAGFTNDLSKSFTSCTWTITAKKTAPDKPSVVTTGTVHTPGSGDAAVPPLLIENECVADASATSSTLNPGISASLAARAEETVSFGGVRISALGWWAFEFEPDVSILHPSTKWTATVTAHFDKTNVTYWNTRFIPYVWKLPYEDGDGADTPARRVLEGTSYEKNGDYCLNANADVDYYINSEQYSGSSLAGLAGSILTYRTHGNALYDFFTFNGYDTSGSAGSIGDFIGVYDKDVKRRSKIFVFESGELPYSAFYMNTTDDRTGWSSVPYAGGTKKIGSNTQIGWYMGSKLRSYYDVSMIFYTCENPANPYGSAAKDLHVVLPQGIGIEWYYDAQNCLSVIGKGRLFLYLTSGDTIYLVGDAYKGASKTQRALNYISFGYLGTNKGNPIYSRPIGGLKRNDDGTIEPLMYIIGAGTNIDLIIKDIPLAAHVYMPFGKSDALYSSSGSLAKYNKFYQLAKGSGSKFSSLYTVNGMTTSVNRNQFTIVFTDSSEQIGNPRIVNGMIVADGFYYPSTGNNNNLSFTNALITPNLGETKIYARSIKSGSTTKFGSYKTYNLGDFWTTNPNFSTSMLNWEYKRIKVVT